MVMQRIANPPTPVRFRLRPPHSKAPQINLCGVFLCLRFGGSLPQFLGSLPQPSSSLRRKILPRSGVCSHKCRSQELFSLLGCHRRRVWNCSYPAKRMICAPSSEEIRTLRVVVRWHCATPCFALNYGIFMCKDTQ